MCKIRLGMGRIVFGNDLFKNTDSKRSAFISIVLIGSAVEDVYVKYLFLRRKLCTLHNIIRKPKACFLNVLPFVIQNTIYI